MCRSLMLVFWLGTTSLALGQVDPESVEPVLEFSLQIQDKVVRVTPGEPVKVPGNFSSPTVKLIPDEFRTFSYGGVSFRYPSNFAFECDLTDENVRTWSLDGASCVIMVQQYSVMIEAEQLASSLVDQYGESNAQVSDTTLTLGGKKLPGKRVTAKVASTTIVQDVFQVPSSKGTTLILLQHTPNDDGSVPAERKHMEKLLSDSFTARKPA